MMNTAYKIIIGILVILALVGAWMYYQGSSNANPTPGDESAAQPVTSADTQGAEATNLPQASGSVDDLSTFINADVSNTSSLSQSDDTDAATAGSATVTNASDATNGSY